MTSFSDARENPRALKAAIAAYKADLVEVGVIIRYIEDEFERELNFKYQLARLEEKWKSVLGYSAKDVQHHLLLITQPQLVDTKKRYTLQELFSEYHNESNWLVSRLFRSAGLYFLVGEPKSGKSLLMYDLIYGVTVSNVFLDFPCKKGKVLLIQLEESAPTLKGRLENRGIDPESDDERLIELFKSDRVTISREFDLQTGLSLLAEELKLNRYSLVVIDSLTAASANVEESMDTAEFVRKRIYPLQRLFILHNTCGIVLHHLNKQPNSKNTSKLARVGGSSRLTAACDGIAFLENEVASKPGKRVILSTVPRDGFSLELLVEKSRGDGGSWEYRKLEEKNVDPEVIEAEGKILRLLANSKEFTKDVIAHKLSCDVGVISSALERLVDGQRVDCIRVKKTKVLKYCIPKVNRWAENKSNENYDSEETGSKDSFDIIPSLIAEELSSCDNLEKVIVAIKDFTEDVNTQAWNKLVKDEKDKIVDIFVNYLASVKTKKDLERTTSINLPTALKNKIWQTISFDESQRLLGLLVDSPSSDDTKENETIEETTKEITPILESKSEESIPVSITESANNKGNENNESDDNNILGGF